MDANFIGADTQSKLKFMSCRILGVDAKREKAQSQNLVNFGLKSQLQAMEKMTRTELLRKYQLTVDWLVNEFKHA